MSAEIGPSRSWEIDSRMRQLLGKLVRSALSRDEEWELQFIQKERVRLMTPRMESK